MLVLLFFLFFFNSSSVFSPAAIVDFRRGKNTFRYLCKSAIAPSALFDYYIIKFVFFRLLTLVIEVIKNVSVPSFCLLARARADCREIPSPLLARSLFFLHCFHFE